MQAYSEILPPTAVTHAVRISFTARRAQNLVVARTSLLQIFDIKVVDGGIEHTPNGVRLATHSLSPSSAAVASNGHAGSQTKLVLVAEYQLSSIITALAAVKVLNAKSGGQALLVSSKDAKLSLVEWEPEIHAISTISIHLYEGEDLQSSPWAPSLAECPTILSVDQSSRCALLKFGQRHLAILPFRQAGDDIDVAVDASARVQQQSNGNPSSEPRQTPYSASFVLSLTALNPSLMHPIDLGFLYEYREPTLGVLFSARSPSTLSNPERRDALSFTVFTLDLEQRASTSLLSVSGLPYDLFKLVALPLPIGGTLLLGGDEIVHIDQSGKTNAIAVNEFAKQSSSFSMVDQSELALKLEDCVVEQLSKTTGDLMIILKTGELCILRFRVDGRSVSGLTLHRVSPTRGGHLLGSAASCAVTVGNDAVFVGSEYDAAVIMCCSQAQALLSRKRSYAEMLGLENVEVSDEEGEDEDDLYGNDGSSGQNADHSIVQSGTPTEVIFTIHDRLLNVASKGDPAFGVSACQQLRNHRSSGDDIELALPIGRGEGGGIAFLQRSLALRTTLQLYCEQPIDDLWAIKAALVPHGSRGQQGDGHENELGHENPDKYIITTGTLDGVDVSSIYVISDQGIDKLNDTNFEEDTITLAAGVLWNGRRIIQVSPGEVRCYDQELGLAQIVPMIDEATDAELRIQQTSFADPYFLVLRSDASLIVLKTEGNGELEEIDLSENIRARKWVSGCLYKTGESALTTYAFLIAEDGGLQVFQLPKLDNPVYSAEYLRVLPSILTNDPIHRRTPVRQNISEILVCDLGDDVAKSTYMLLRSREEDLILYEAYHSGSESGQSFVDNLKWIRVSLNQLPGEQESFTEAQQKVMRLVQIGKHVGIAIASQTPVVILRDASSKPRLLRIQTSSSTVVTAINHVSSGLGLLLADAEGSIAFTKPVDNVDNCQTGWSSRCHHLGEEVEAVAYHADTGFYVIGTSVETNFSLPEDDWHHEWSAESTSFLPAGVQGNLHLYSPAHGSVIHKLELQPDERIMCMQTLDLEISERTRERKSLTVVGTAIVRGEDLPAMGSIYVVDIITVVPDPERPETNKALKVIVREESRGPVTAISEIGTEGFLLAAQGQKCMVRGLKEDNTLLPVAFMDMQCYISSLKNIRGTGLVMMADALRGIWFAGFMGDPYAMRLLGKSSAKLEVMATEFLPHGKQLFLLAADTEYNLNVLEFNPENPKSLSGQRLLTRSTFHLGDAVMSMKLLPSQPVAANGPEINGDHVMDDVQEQEYTSQVLMTMQSGAIGLVTTLDEQTYRRLDALQTQLFSILDHPCGLNPRAYRRVESEGFGARGIIDGQVLKRWGGLGGQRRAETCTRVGAEIWQIERDIGLISGCELTYL